eukprot:CAMPEP_0115875292 /NCGR_PEP_ID=MMETSP0287-20121206/25019_1 /TAXON_ID=412157 /ORGANISM="Chrysochromulina rotalis, Strain UIO044" /LENGTH=95 /DNA_ID=CAMNT_0003330545 /DNA_START=149 /DNA_END=434 /DNA_ORIENTATION=+
MAFGVLTSASRRLSHATTAARAPKPSVGLLVLRPSAQGSDRRGGAGGVGGEKSALKSSALLSSPLDDLSAALVPGSEFPRRNSCLELPLEATPPA